MVTGEKSAVIKEMIRGGLKTGKSVNDHVSDSSYRGS